ncbi:MAG: hypothetical protein IJ719_18435, partial [Clostridia bacterium]|nr:hypothetical protein [Clostridia bacterium]
TEVQRIMFDMYNPKYVEEAEHKTEIYQAVISAGRRFGASDEEIEKELVENHGVTVKYAENLVKCKRTEDAIMAV